VRDTTLIRIDREDFEQIVVKRPEVMLAIVKALAKRLKAQGRSAPRGFGQHFAVVGNRPGVPVGEVASRVTAAFGALGRALLVNPESLAQAGVMDNAGSIADDHPAWLRWLAWLDEQDQVYDYVVFEGGDEGAAWTTRCVRQADHVLLVARADDPDPAPTGPERALEEATKPRGVRRTLVLLHPDGATPPTGTAAWLEQRKVDGHLHLRLDRADDFGRTARILAGRAVGLVLGGGGARGFAHIGVIKALREAGVPVDWVGGTSMGSIIGGMVAMELPADEMVHRNEAIVRMRPFTEFTVPVFALLRTKRIERAARTAFGTTRIEDLWLPFFCVSASLTTARMVVHERGPVWEATRASGALPGITLPVLMGGAMLVDGGVVDNLPTEVMRSRCRGKIIAVNVSPDVDDAFVAERLPTPWSVLASWLSPMRRALRVPTIVHVMMRTATLASADRAREAERQADLYLRPAIGPYGLLEFERIRDIVDVGYACGRDRLQGFRP
jgi:NTE family protein/lysophospholipid hydrolase